MTKLAMYRNNSAYEQFLAPALSGREDFEMQIFPQGTPESEIITWITEHATQIRSMETVYMDKTCYKAGETLPSVKRPDSWGCNIWNDVATNYGGFDYQVFRKAASVLTTKATVEETIAEVVRHLLAKEAPTKVLLIQDHMGDHNLFGLGLHSADRKEKAQRDAEKLHSCLKKVTGQPVFYLDVSSYGLDAGVTITDEDTVWVFFDRHFKTCEKFLWEKIPKNFRQFRVPIENLVEDAVAFGVDFDTESFSREIREIVATW